MIQAVADDEERGAPGMQLHERSEHPQSAKSTVPRQLRVRMEEAGGNARALLNLRKRISKIRVFDPACGSW